MKTSRTDLPFWAWAKRNSWSFGLFFHRWNYIHFPCLFNCTKALFSQFSVRAGKQDRPTPRQGQSSLLFPSGIRTLGWDGLQKLHQHPLVPSVPASAADSPPRCSGLDFSVTKCFHTLLKEEHHNPVKGQCTPSFQCIFIPSILGIYFQIFLYGQCKKKKIRISGRWLTPPKIVLFSDILSLH